MPERTLERPSSRTRDAGGVVVAGGGREKHAVVKEPSECCSGSPASAQTHRPNMADVGQQLTSLWPNFGQTKLVQARPHLSKAGQVVANNVAQFSQILAAKQVLQTSTGSGRRRRDTRPDDLKEAMRAGREAQTAEARRRARQRERRARARWSAEKCRDRVHRLGGGAPARLCVAPGVFTADRSAWRRALHRPCLDKYSFDAEHVLRRREVIMKVLENEQQVMRRDNHKIWRWRIAYTIEARAAVKQGKSPGGRSPLTPEVLQALSWQVLMELDGLFRSLYEDPSKSVPDVWRMLRLTMLPKVSRASELCKFRGISLIDAMAKSYIAALTRLLRCELQACAPSDYKRPLVFGYEEGAAAKQIGVGLSALFQKSSEWQHAQALYVLSVDGKSAFDKLMPESVLHALRSFGVSARTRRAFAHVLFGNKGVARLEVETDEFPYLPMRQGGVESTVLWNVFLRRLLLDLDIQFHTCGGGVDIGGLGKVACLAWADNLYLVAESMEKVRQMLDMVVRHGRGFGPIVPRRLQEMGCVMSNLWHVC